MGLSGVLAGGSLLAVTGLLAGILATVLPMWLITRLELHAHLCWTGTGLWLANYVWGDDIPEMGLECKGEYAYTSDLYCGPDATDFERSMCLPTRLAKGSMISTLIVGLVTLFVAWRFGTKKYQADSINYLDELFLSKLLVGLSMLACVLASVGFGVVFFSNLFSAAHAKEISSSLPVPFESAGFGCVFQSPLRASSLKTVIKSSPLNCLYGGPAFAMAATSLASWGIASLFFLLLFRDVRRLQNTLDIDPNARLTPKPQIRNPLLTELLYPRNYSIYGAVSRHFWNSRWRRVFVLTLPILAMGTMVHFAAMMLLNGAAVQVFIRLSSPAFSPREWKNVLVDYPAHIASFPEIDKLGEDVAQPGVVEIIEEVFDFTMLTSIKNFWDGKAYALAILTAVFCAVWPYVRVVIQLVMYFIPIPEHDRGRTLTWIDSLGKWTLVNTFVLSFMGVAFHLHSQLRFRGLFPRSKDLLDVEIEVSLGPRVATYMFLFGTIASIIISEIFVTLHRYCREWEERRNAESLQGRNNDSSIVVTLPDLLRGASPPPSDANLTQADQQEDEPRPPLASIATKKVVYQHGFGYEALCERHHTPLRGKAKYKYTPLAKCLVWISLGFTACTTLAGMLQVSAAFTFEGLVGDVIVDEHEKRREFSLVSIGTALETDMGATTLGGIFLTGVYFSFAFVAPLLRLGGLTVLWYVPMRPNQQKSWFHLLEILESWSALDVYFVSILAATLEISDLSQVILGQSFPAVEELVNSKFPQFGGLFLIKQELLNGMYLILIGVAFEKFMALFIIAQTANAVAERIAEERLALERNRMLPSVREENDLIQELDEHPETWAILSPAARYTSASANTKIVYSGLPRILWMLGIRLGLMSEVQDRSGLNQVQGAGAEGVYFSLEGV